MKLVTGSSLGVALVAVLVSGASPANAYGPEGLFGGRPQPDNTIVLGNPVELKNDRPDRAESVLEHPRTDFDPAPIDVGSFELFPSIEVGSAYDSNIYASKTTKKDDMINSVRPVVNVFSNWGQHAVSMTTYGDVNFYSTNSHEDYQTFVTDWNGRYDIMSQTFMSVRGGFQHLTEARSTPDATNGTEPTTFDLAKAGVGFYRGVGKVKVGANYDLQRFDYNNTPTTSGVVDQSGRNHYEHVVEGTVGYDVSGNVKPYVKAHYNNHDYDNNAVHQSNGYDAVVGSTVDFGGITSVDAYVGGMQQNFRNFTAQKDVVAPKFGGRVDWNVTGLTSVVFEVSRTIEDFSDTDFSSYIATGGSATLTHELRRNILLESDVSFTRDDFEGTRKRQDDNVSAGVGGRYLVNRHMYSDLSYSWSRRYSDDSASNYLRNLAMLRLGFRL